MTRVEYVKRTGKKNFVIVDAAMNDLIRPAFYDAYHEIVPLERKARPMIASDVVGGICESGDYFCKDRPLPKLGEGDLLAMFSAGAYGSSWVQITTPVRCQRKFWWNCLGWPRRAYWPETGGALVAKVASFSG